MVARRVEQYDLFRMVLAGKSYFSEPGGLPNIRSFISDFQKDLRDILAARWRTLQRGSEMPLVVNILINPELFFCKHDAAKAQYSRYFCPIYLDDKAAAFDREPETMGIDRAAQEIVHLHHLFERHYRESVLARPGFRSFLSLNDIESLVASSTPIPQQDTVITIRRTGGGSRTKPRYPVQVDLIEYDFSHLMAQLRERGIHHPEVAFTKYRELVTRHGGSYHHVTIGDDTRWLGRVYIAFRGQVEPTEQWVRRAKLFAFECVATFALAGTFLRNAGIINLLSEVRGLVLAAGAIQRAHRGSIDQLAGSRAIENRKRLPSTDDLNTSIERFLSDGNNWLPGLHTHITTSKCRFCSDARNSTEPIRHAIRDCPNGGRVGDTAGAAFASDIAVILADTCKGLEAEARSLIAHSIVFGLISDPDRPKVLNGHLGARAIHSSWLTKCVESQTTPEPPREVKPYVLALLAMCGNTTMVQSNAEKLQLTLGNKRAIAQPQKEPGGRLLLKVTYEVMGTLARSGNTELIPLSTEELHQNRARLLLYFGRYFLEDGFQMCISTKVNGAGCTALSGNWGQEYPSEEGTITFAFRFGI